MYLDAIVYSIPLRTKFRGITVREGVLLRGPAGWAEFSPFWDYDAAESAPWLEGAIDAAVNGYPEPRRTSIPINVTVPAVGPSEAARIATSGGCGTAKIKIAEPGQSVDDDVARVSAVRAALPEAKIRVDVNGKWSVAEALERIPIVDRAARGLEYVEQPCASVEELAEVRRKVDVPIAADESIRRAIDPFRVKELDAADVVVLKNQPLGGVRRALEIAEKIKLPVVVSSALESSVGLRAGLALAASLPELPYACGLGTVRLFENDVVDNPLLPNRGEIEAGSEPEPNLDRCIQDAETQARWIQRVDEVLAFLRAGHGRTNLHDLQIRFLPLGKDAGI